MRVLIAGCGYVGSALGARLASAGHTVFGLRRRPVGLPAGVVPVAADLGAAERLDAIPEGIDQVVYSVSPSGRDDEAYARAYVAGPSALLELLARRGEKVGRFVLTTSTGVYAQDDGRWVDEESPTEPSHHSGRRMLEGERVVLDGSLDATAIRLAGIYGPGRTSLIERVRRGEVRQPRSSWWTNRIHRDDCAGAIEHLLALPRVERLYIGVDRKPAEMAEVQRWLAAELGVPEPPLAEEEPGDATGRRARSNKRCRGDRLVASGYGLSFPTYREGYRAVLAGD